MTEKKVLFLREVAPEEELRKQAGLTIDAERWLRGMFRQIAEQAVSEVTRAGNQGTHYTAIDSRTRNVVAQLIDDKYRKLVAVTKVAPKDRKFEVVYAEMREEARTKLTKELRSARKRKSVLAKECRSLRERVKQLQHSAWALGHAEATPMYPDVPEDMRIMPFEDPTRLPDSSGVYFLWHGGIVEYVGQSVSLYNRIGAGANCHGALEREHTVSYLLVSKKDLLWTESYYIGLLRPRLNFRRTQERLMAEDLEE